MLTEFGIQEIRPGEFRVVVPRPRTTTQGTIRGWVHENASFCIHRPTKSVLHKRDDLTAEQKRCWHAVFGDFTEATLFWFRWG